MRRPVPSVTCPDRVGIVDDVTRCIAARCGWVVEATRHGDLGTGRFFQRIEIPADSLPGERVGFGARIVPLAADLKLNWHLSDTDVPKRVVVMASRQGPLPGGSALPMALRHAPPRQFPGRPPLPDLAPPAEASGIPFAHFPMGPDNRADAIEEICARFEDVGGNVTMLARFMQIAPAEVCDRYVGRIITMHHRFLSSFANARLE